jgi:hypothetical protein
MEEGNKMKRLIAFLCLVMTMAGSTMAQPGIRHPMFDWRGSGDGNLPKLVGYYFREDAVSMNIEEGDFGNNDTMKIVLQAVNGWRKEISFFACNGVQQTIFTHNSVRTAEMTINRMGCFAETLVFRKEKIFTGMHTMYHMDPAPFWKMWGGKKVTITWSDDLNGMPNPPPCVYECIPIGTDPYFGMAYDSDNKADVAVFRPNSGEWFPINSSTGVHWYIPGFGQSGDIPVPRDYDRDGIVDAAVFRPSTKQFIILNSFSGTQRIVNHGVTGDLPVVGDFDGDGRIDVGVWRPAGSAIDRSRGWRAKLSSGGIAWTRIGAAGDLPVAGDYDGDHVADPAVFRNSNATWLLAIGIDNAIITQQWGEPGDIPVPADYDGDGKDDLAVWRPTTGFWYIKQSSNGATRTELYGMNGDRPVPADYDGDNKTDLAYLKPNGDWFIKKSSDGEVKFVPNHGLPTDIPVPRK